MMVKVLKFRFSESALADNAIQVRSRVFVEEQGVDHALEYDGMDEYSNHFLAFDGKKAVSTARWRETEKGIKLERFATLKEYRSKGFGQAILIKMLNDVLPLGKTIYLHAQESAVSFYLKNGFQIKGEEFFEAGIRHFRMELT